MLSVQTVAKALHFSPEQLQEESLRLYLYQQLRKVETELFRYGKKYGITTITELDMKLQEGLLTEEEIHDDFFIIDHLESERDRLLKFLGAA